MPKQTRQYQEDAINNVLDLWNQGHYGVLGAAATGAGKTYIASRILAAALGPRGRAVFNAPRIEIVDSTAATMRELGLQVGIVQGDRREVEAQVVVGTKDSIANNIDDIIRAGTIDIEVTDEAHHVVAPTYQKIRGRLGAANERLLSLGITATPKRTDGIALAKAYSKVGFVIPIRYLVDNGYLARPIPWKFNMPQGATDQEIVQMVIKSWEQKTRQGFDDARRRTLMFVSTTSKSREFAGAFRAAGYLFADISGNTPRAERAECLRLFEEGRLQGVVNDDVWTEGVDIVPIDTIVNMKPTASTTVFTQAVGRGLRIDLDRYPEKKDCLILNYAPRDSQKLGFVDADDILGMGSDDVATLRGMEQDLFQRESVIYTPNLRGNAFRNWIRGGAR